MEHERPRHSPVEIVQVRAVFCRDSCHVSVAMRAEELIDATRILLVCLDEDKADVELCPWDAAQHVRLVPFDVDAEQVDGGSELVLLKRLQKRNACHSTQAVSPTRRTVDVDAVLAKLLR